MQIRNQEIYYRYIMRTFIIRARKGTTRWEKIRSSIGGKEHLEVIAHCVMNAFFISNGFRADVEVYIILDSSEDFPRTIKLSGHDGLSIKGFHEEAVLELIEKALKNSVNLKKDETQHIDSGIQISGFGFEKLVSQLIQTRCIYLLDPKGENIQSLDLAALTELSQNPVFILSDHLAMPKNSIKTFKRRGLKLLSLGKKMLFASQCVVLLNYYMDII